MQKPIVGNVYTFDQVLKLDLSDSPSFSFLYKDTRTVIQTAHTTDQELLSVPVLAQTKWQYIMMTTEWIPVFYAVDSGLVLECVDIEADLQEEKYGDFREFWWVTPKGFHREQP